MLLVSTKKSCPHCHKTYDTELGGCLWWLIGHHGLGQPTKRCENCRKLFSTNKDFWSKLPLYRKLVFFIKASIYSWFNFYVIGYTFLLTDWIDRPKWPDGESRDYVLYWTIAWYVCTSLVFLAVYVYPLLFSKKMEEDYNRKAQY
jgi:hypothetical protein